MPRRPGMILRESVIRKLRLRGQQVIFIKINTIRVDTEREDFSIDEE